MASNISKRVVRVLVDVSFENGKPRINCHPNTVHVTKPNSLLSFTLTTSGYRFRKSKAIKLDTPDSDFPYNSWTEDETNATLFDLNNNNDTFAYTVTVVNTTTGEQFSIDPEIKNGGAGPGHGDDDDDGDDDDC